MTSLRQRMTEDMQVRNFSPHTQASYVQQVSLFARHFSKSPEGLGPDEIRSYQVYLTNERKLAPSSILIAIVALRFLYKVTLHKDGRNHPGAQEASKVAFVTDCSFRRFKTSKRSGRDWHPVSLPGAFQTHDRLESGRSPTVLKLRAEH